MQLISNWDCREIGKRVWSLFQEQTDCGLPTCSKKGRKLHMWHSTWELEHLLYKNMINSMPYGGDSYLTAYFSKILLYVSFKEIRILRKLIHYSSSSRFRASAITMERVLSIVIFPGWFFTGVISHCLPLKGSDSFLSLNILVITYSLLKRILNLLFS